MTTTTPMPVVFIPHGGGPLPLLGDLGHRGLTRFLTTLGAELPPPRAVLVVSAHWEAKQPTLTGAAEPGLIYDYYGFPPESYQISYPAPGAPALASTIADRLQAAGFDAQLDPERGFDHGLFVPLKLIYPDANVPCLQLSLLSHLDPATHLALGEALAPLRDEGVLILGSGLSFHNLPVMLGRGADAAPAAAFDGWLVDSCCDPALSADARRQALTAWEQAPHARYCHPRAEHLLPLHVCAGAAGYGPGRAIFREPLMGQPVSALRWD